MKKIFQVVVMGSILSILVACGTTADNTQNQMPETNNATENGVVSEIAMDEAVSEDTDVVGREEEVETNQTQNESLDASESVKTTEYQENSDSVSDLVEVDEITGILENLVGEHEYTSDLGDGKLIIQKSEFGYDISDYTSEFAYRFLANSSNIEKIDNNQIDIKYPAQVHSDDTVIFEYYTLKYDADKIEVLYRQTENDEPEVLYSAIRKK